MNCCFSADVSLQTISLMKEALDKEGLKPHLMIQPSCYHTPDYKRNGYLPETPFGELAFPSMSYIVIELASHYHHRAILT